MRDILDNPDIERAAACAITLAVPAVLYVLAPLLVPVMLYIMGGLAGYYLWTYHIRPGIEVRKFRRDLG